MPTTVPGSGPELRLGYWPGTVSVCWRACRSARLGASRMAVLSVREARAVMGEAACRRCEMAVRGCADGVSGRGRESRGASIWTKVAGRREDSVIGAMADTLEGATRRSSRRGICFVRGLSVCARARACARQGFRRFLVKVDDLVDRFALPSAVRRAGACEAWATRGGLQARWRDKPEGNRMGTFGVRLCAVADTRKSQSASWAGGNRDVVARRPVGSCKLWLSNVWRREEPRRRLADGVQIQLLTE